MKETTEVSLVQEMEEVSPEEELEVDRQTLVLELRKEVPVVFMEYRNYNRIDLTMKRGWDQYLPKAPGAQCPDPVIVTAPAVVVVLNVVAGGSGQPRVAGFFSPRTATTAPATAAPALPTVSVGGSEVQMLSFRMSWRRRRMKSCMKHRLCCVKRMVLSGSFACSDPSVSVPFIGP